MSFIFLHTVGVCSECQLHPALLAPPISIFSCLARLASSKTSKTSKTALSRQAGSREIPNY